MEPTDLDSSQYFLYCYVFLLLCWYMEESATIELISTIVPFAIIVFVIAIGVVFLSQQFQKSIYRQRLEKEALKINYQKKLLQVTIKVQETEQKKIAKNIHDELGASLSISRMLLKQLEDERGYQKEKIKEVREIIETTLTSARRISHELMPLELSKLGLNEALCTFASKAEKIGQTTINVAITPNLLTLPWNIEIGLFRIYKELINNSLKHAQASQIDITIYRENDLLFCRYSDDGVGIKNKNILNGIGLQNIESRITAFNGSINYGNNEFKGFYSEMKIPLLTTDTTNNYAKAD